jgi:hypothetical protein
MFYQRGERWKRWKSKIVKKVKRGLPDWIIESKERKGKSVKSRRVPERGQHESKRTINPEIFFRAQQEKKKQNDLPQLQD